MAKLDIINLKEIFKHGEKITQESMYSLLDSYRHKDDEVDFPTKELDDISVEIDALKRYDIGPLGFSGSPTSEEVDWLIIGADVTIDEGKSGHAYAIVPASENLELKILHNENEIGAISFNSGDNVGEVTINTLVQILEGDRLAIVAPEIPDFSFRNMQVIIKSKISDKPDEIL